MTDPFSRRIRNKRDRAILYFNASGLCENCGKILSDGWHVDHHIPWSLGGKTVMSNLRALCQQCNLKKGSTMPSSNVISSTDTMLSPVKYEHMKHFCNDFPNAKGVRKCQIGAYNCFYENIIVLGKKQCSISMATGSGKSDVVRYAALGLKKSKKYAGVWAFSPSVHLRDQLKGDRVDEFFDRCKYPTNGISPFVSVQEIEQPLFRNNSVLESYTTQKLTTRQNIDLFLMRAQKLFNDTGKYPVVFFDESHLFSTDNVWGAAAVAFSEAGIPIILITGTPYRSDYLQIPGFHIKLIDEFSRPYTKTRKTLDPFIIQVEKGNSQVCKYELKADYDYSYQRAWEDDVILKPEPCFIDATKDISKQFISEMPLCEAGRLLRIFLMDERTIAYSVKEAIKSIKMRKISDHRCAALVTTLSDDEFDENNNDFGDIHAKRVKREFQKQAPELKVLVVTSNNNSDDGLSRFEDKCYDVLIVKAMGTIGYNCPRIKTVLHLSNYRTLPAFIQLANRGCRHFAENSNYDVIMPKDPGMILTWDRFQTSTKLVIEDKIDTMESEVNKKIVPQEDSENIFTHFNNHQSSFDPATKRCSNDKIIEDFNQVLPELACKISQREKLNIFNRFSNSLGDEFLEKIINNKETVIPLVDSNELESRLRGEAGDLVKEITIEIIKMCSLSMKDYGTVTKKVWTDIKKNCGFRPNQTLENLCGITNFQRIIESGTRLKTEIFKKNSDFDYARFLKFRKGPPPL